jgi:D-alanyl-D-alanine dipeptidase
VGNGLTRVARLQILQGKCTPPGRCFRFPELILFALLCCSFIPASLRAQSSLLLGPKPPDAPSEWKNFIGDFGRENATYFVFERGAALFLLHKGVGDVKLISHDADSFSAATPVTPGASNPTLRRGPQGVVTLEVADAVYPRHNYLAENDRVYKIHPLRPVEELRSEALRATPPRETGMFRKPELVEVTTLDPLIHLDIRYATSNDFLGTPVYTQARAFLERPAAEALLRVLKKMQPLGYGLLIHDAYRPWYVTKIFWDATPPEGKIFVADPAQGSRHNRGCAVDLTLYDLATGQPIEMPGSYDEMSPRSFPDYPGGTSLQRWHRDLLRRAMESEGFSVYEAEWWHFDYKDWHDYPILNVPFERVDPGKSAN